MKVKLQEVLEALDGVGMDMEYYYDTKNEEILMIFDGMVNGETDPDLIEDIEEGFIEDYIPLPRQYDMNEYRMMEEFIYDLPAGRAQDALDVAIRGKGAFRRFKDGVILSKSSVRGSLMWSPLSRKTEFPCHVDSRENLK